MTFNFLLLHTGRADLAISRIKGAPTPGEVFVIARVLALSSTRPTSCKLGPRANQSTRASTARQFFFLVNRRLTAARLSATTRRPADKQPPAISERVSGRRGRTSVFPSYEVLSRWKWGVFPTTAFPPPLRPLSPNGLGCRRCAA